MIKDCPKAEVYHGCGKSGHKVRDCKLDWDKYGEYGPEIQEGTPGDNNDTSDLEAEKQYTHSDSLKLLLGTSNCTRLNLPINASVSGATLNTIEKTRKLIPDETNVEAVVLCLGTNDVT